MYDVATVRAIVRNSGLCAQINQAATNEQVEAIIQQNNQVIFNTVSALSQASAVTAAAPAAAPTGNSDAAIESFIRSISGHSATLTPQVVKDTLAKHPEWAAKYEEALSKGSDTAHMYLMGNLDLIGELFVYI